ncbi:TIGR00282 family metallophosphoesterase [Pseudodesulfovibrio tunisiensis]|uniref:TIGR00282 family metallophosphoesterase n=1 Tax=Pseudodesulfovibrio tunisiensis TaxID=463192 RepID=UPI001FB4097B|nr:TIGR00282 family metallophosphoesterase [Pseudodesulfovibrio tunisiensis]
MRILFLGDIVGRPGRKLVRERIAGLRAELGADLVFANGENASAGLGLSAKNARELLNAGIDALTSGNHIWKFKDVWNLLDTDSRLLRPHNYPAGPGTGVRIIRADGLPPVALINLLGRTFMPPVDCPFRAVDRILDELDPEIRIRVVDFHAEATSEKQAMGFHLDGRVSAVLGTHTHVPTADACVLEHGTAYITDLGMCGPQRSCLGMKPDIIVKRFLDGLPARFEVASEPGILQGAIFDIEESSGQVKTITPVTTV